MNGYFRNQQAVFFKDRIDAGQRLAGLLKSYKGSQVVVYALPRGGVVLGAEIAKRLNAPLDLIITRKIGHPYIPEYAIGATAENGHAVFNKDEILDVDPNWFKEEAERQKLEAKRRRELYLQSKELAHLGGKKPISCTGKIAILVDDGVATGLTMKAAIKELQIHYKPEKIIAAVAVIPWEMADELEKDGVEVVAVITDKDFLGSIGAYYQNFSAVEDMDVIKIMEEVGGYGHIPIQTV